MTSATILRNAVRKLQPCRPTDVLDHLELSGDERRDSFAVLEGLWLRGLIVIGDDLYLRDGPADDVEPLYRPPVRLTGTLEDGRGVIGWACRHCLMPFGDEDIAAACCKPWFCRTCGEKTEKFWTLCRRCRNEQDEINAVARAAKAERIVARQYTHQHVWLADEDEPTELGDWWSDVDDGDAPSWAWASRDLGLPQLDAIHILEGHLSGHHDEAIEEVDVEALQMHLDGWWRTQSVSSFEKDEHRIVIVVSDELQLAPRCPDCESTERRPEDCQHPWHGPVLLEGKEVS